MNIARIFYGFGLTGTIWGVMLVHASADGPERWHYITDSNAAERCMTAATRIDPAIRYVFCGHVHEQALYFLTPTAKLMRFSPQPGVPVPVPPHRQWLAIAGSCGQPPIRSHTAQRPTEWRGLVRKSDRCVAVLSGTAG